MSLQKFQKIGQAVVVGSLAAVVLYFGSAQLTRAADLQYPAQPKPPMASSSMAKVTARLVDEAKKAQQRAATVEVTATGIELIDPAKVDEKPNQGQGHLHYQVDDGPIIATTTTKLSFHELKAGTHKIVVTLAGNDHKPLGPQETLTVKIP